MVQLWYNRLLWTSLLVLLIGTLIGMPILKWLDLDIILYSNIVLIIPISGIIFLLLMVWGGLSRRNYFGHWINRHSKTPGENGGN